MRKTVEKGTEAERAPRLNIGGQARQIQVGGQAVLEGVMMRGPSHYAVAVRRPDGEIVVRSRDVSFLTKRFPILTKPVLRGLIVLIDTIALGVSALSFSAHQAAGEEVDFGAKEIALSIVGAAVLAALLFVLLPVGLTSALRSYIGASYLRSLLEGLLRLTIFLGYLAAVSRLRDIRRVFEYHGAEHKAVHAYEAGEALSIANVQKHSPLHMGCGTAFLLIVMVLAVFVFAFIPRSSTLLRILIQLVLVPFIASLSYEIIRLARRHGDSRLVRLVMAPGLLLQKLTAREPTTDQLEVAITALTRVLEEEEGAEEQKSRRAEEV